MNAQEAARIVDSGSFDGQDLDVLFRALQNDSKYAEQLKKLLYQMEVQTYRSMCDLEGAVGVDWKRYDESVSLDEDSMRKLESIDFAETKSINGKKANVTVSKAQNAKIRKMIEEAARAETMDELRGLTSPESKNAKAFRAAATPEKRLEIYAQTLRTNVDCAIVNMVLGEDTYKRYTEGKAKCKNEEEAKSYLQKFADSLGKEVQQKFALVEQLGKKGEINGKKGIIRIKLGAENAAAYCSGVHVRVTENMKVYAKNIADRIKQIEQKAAFLSAKGRDYASEKWNEVKKDISNAVAEGNEQLAQKLERLEQNGKVVFGKTWEITKKLAKSAWSNRRQILADTGAAMAYSAALGVGGPVALGVGVAYAGYTVWRRVVKPLKEHKQSGKPLDAKFWVKAAVGVGASFLSLDIASHVAGMQDLAGTALTQAAAEVAKARAARVMVTAGGAVAGNAAGVVQAAVQGDKKLVKSELKQLAFTAALSGLTAWGASYIGSGHGTEAANEQDSLPLENDNSGNVAAPTDSIEGRTPADSVVVRTPADSVEIRTPTDSAEVRMPSDSTVVRTPVDSAEVSTPTDSTVVNAPADNTAETETPAAEDQNSASEHTVETDDYPWDFPDHNPENSGITDKQFNNLRKIIMSHADGDETVLNRMYHNAAANAVAMSPDPNNPLTPEEILYKFTRAGAWTGHEGGKGWAWVNSGNLKEELSAIWNIIGCDNKVDAETLSKVRVLMGSIDKTGHITKDIWQIHPEMEKYNNWNEQGQMLGESDKVLVGVSGDCHDGKLHFERSGARERVVEHTQETPQAETVETKSEVVRETAEQTSKGDREIVHEENASVVEKTIDAVVETPQKQEADISVGVLHDESAEAGINGADVHERVANGEDVGDVAANKAAVNSVARRMAARGALTPEQLRAIQERNYNTK